MAPSSSPAQDAWFSAMRHRFESGWGYLLWFPASEAGEVSPLAENPVGAIVLFDCLTFLANQSYCIAYT